MRILHVAASYLPARRYGGTIVSVHGLCRALAARGNDVHVFTTSVDGPADSPVAHGVPVDVEGVHVWYFQSRMLRRLYWSPPLARQLRASVGGFDVVHTHAIFLWPLWAAAREARRAGVPYVMSPRGMLEKALVEQKSPLWKAAIIGFIEKRHFEHASAIHVTSRREADQAVAFGFDFPPFHEIPNGVDPGHEGGTVDAAVGDIISRGPFALYLGRINWKKGLDRLLRALANAPGVRLVLAGNDEDGYRRTLDAIAAEVGVSGRVRFAGEVSGVTKSALLRSAQMVVLPSYSENFGNVVLEAMAAGRPVVVTPEVGIADLVRSSGAGLVVSGDPQSLGGALASLAADAPLRGRLGERAGMVAQQLSWDAIAARMEQLYRSLAVPGVSAGPAR